MKILLGLCFLLNQNIFCASTLLRSVLKPKTELGAPRVELRREKKVEEFVHKEDNVVSPFGEIAIAGLEDEKKERDSLPILNRCYLHPDTGTLGIFNGPWAEEARNFFKKRFREKGSIETSAAMKQAIVETQECIGNEVDQAIKTTGAIVVLNSVGKLIWGCFPGDYLLAVQKPEGVTYLAKPFSDQRQVRAAIEIKEFDQHLAAEDKLILSTPDPIGLLLLTKPKELSLQDLDEAHGQLKEVIKCGTKASNPALGIMEKNKIGVERVLKKSVCYGPKATLVVATIKDRSY